LVPSHGEVMADPIVAIDAVLERVERCYDTYVGISALRHYFPDMFREFEGRPNHMPFTEKLDVPDFLYHWGTTWAIRAENGELFVMDCGAPRVIEEIDKRVESGEISGVTEFWITHYHDDHVDQVPALQQKFDCVTRADRVVADVVSNPLAYRFPCISEAVCRIDHITDDGDSWGWNEFTMTAFHFPGQTFYHGGLLVEGRGVRLFFSGDSFTPSGIDDYCAANRNLLGIDFGYERCLDVLDETQPTHIFNCHVDCAFRFSEDEMRQMRRNLHHRETAFGELFAWDHPNYGMDPHWVRAHPYEQSAVAGATITLAVELTNHSDEARVAVVKPMPPNGWGDAPPQTAVIPPKRVGKVVFRIAIPPNETPRRLVIPFDLVYDRRPLPAFREAVVVVHEEPNRASSR
ncbi:MAG: MBL fold metallo-hydrolase, partial [Candidatus Poribacteria bacterium]|nr:MBL fold metallo-hydrolase [Candidatus Poribacteria bacterium]